MNIALDPTECHPSTISPEQRLFIGVIVNAAIEAAGRGSHICADDRARNQMKAVAWFRDATDDFEMVCNLAGLDPETVRVGVTAYIDRAEAGDASTPNRGTIRHRRSGRVTISDIAHHAKVSPTSVHNVLRNRATPKVTSAVTASIAALGYERPTHAR